MQHFYLKNRSILNRCTYPLCALLLLLATTFDLNAQSCECTNCGAFVGPLSSTTFEFYADGAINNDLSSPTQGICSIEIDFVPDHIWSLEMTLTSPGGQTITLIGSQSFQIGVTGPLTWNIDFVPCGEAAMPDVGFNDVWDNNQNWLLANPYSGAYYPHIGCLEDFNTGTVDGNWILTVDNSHPLSSVEIVDFNIIFCEEEGLGCFECGADAGMLNDITGGKACQGDSSLILDVFPVYPGDGPDSTIYGYTYVIGLEDTIVGYDTIPDLTNYGAGVYTVCGMSYLLEDASGFPTPNNTVTITTLRDNLASANPSYCGSITTDCVTMLISPVDTTFIIEAICPGDTLFIDTLALDQTGIYQLDYINTSTCDSILIIDLTVQSMIMSQIQDTVCAEEPYFFNDVWLEDSGSYADTLQTTVGCDSFVFLKFLRLDSIITNLEAVICQGDSFLVGATYFDSTGIYDQVLTAESGCDSIVILDLTVLNPVINIAPVIALDCNNPTVLIDASGSIGEGLTFEWLDIINAGAGIVSGMNEAILEVSLPGNYLLTLTDTLGGNQCDTLAIAVVGYDYSTPLINLTTDTIDCSNPPIQIQTDTVTSIATYDWSGPNAYTSMDADPLVELPGIYTVIVTGVNSCIDSFTVTIAADTIVPLITSVAVDDTLTCSNPDVQLSATASPGMLDYNWTGPGSFDVDLQNPIATTPGNYILTVEGVNGCTSDTTITVLQNIESPVIQIQTDTLGCAPDTIQLFSTSNIPGSSFRWLGPSSFESFEQNPFVTEPGFYGLTVTGPNGCTTIQFVNIMVDTEVPVVTILGDTLGCAPDTIVLQGFFSVSGSTFDWTGPGSFTAAIANPEVTTPGIYDLTVTAPNGCQTSSSITITANTDQPIVTIISDTLGCLPDTIVLQSFSSILGSEFLWNGPGSFSSAQSNPEVTEAGMYNLQVTAPNGCQTTSITEVGIDSIAPILTIIGDTIDCNTDTITLQSFSSILGSTFSWTGPDSFNSAQSNPEVSEAGTYVLTITAPNGCEASDSIVITSDIVSPVISIMSDTLNCAPDTITLQSFSDISGSTFSWTGPGSFTAAMSNPEITTPGTYDLTVTAPNGCETLGSTIVEADEEVPVVTILGDTLGCAPDTIVLQGFSSVSGSTFDWTGPGSFTAAIANPEVTDPGIYNLTVTAPNGCQTSSSITIIANTDQPIVTIISDTLGCLPDTIVLQSFSSIPGSEFLWNGPGSFSSAQSNPAVTEAGVYNLQVTAPNGCQTTSSAEVEIDSIAPILTIIGDTIDCNTDTITLQSFSSISGSTFSWTGPGSFNTAQSNPEVSEAGTYVLTITALNGCEASDSIVITSDIVSPIISIISDTLNCAPDTITLQSFSDISGSTFSWTGPGSFTAAVSNPEITTPGTYDLTVTAPNGCETLGSTIVEADEEVPVVMILGDTLGCAPDTIVLQSFSSVSGSIFDWTGPGSFTAAIATPEVTNPGIYNLTVTAANGCQTSNSITITANTDQPIVTIISDTLGCLPDTVVLQSFSSIPGSEFLWDGPGSFSSAQSNPEVTEAGMYNLQVTAPNGCQTTSSTEVGIDSIAPILTIIGDTIDCNTDTITLQSFSSIPGSTFSWTGPDSFNSAQSNPEVSESGTYNLQVTASNGCEASDSIVITSDIVSPVISIISDTLNCAPDTITLQSFSDISGSTFSWTGPGSFTAAISNPEITTPGTYDLTVTAPNGCETLGSTIVEADEEVPVVTILGDTLGCAPDTIVLQGFSSVSGSTFDWTGPGSFTAAIANPEVTTPGIYNLTVTAPNGCESMSSIMVTVDLLVPIATAIGDTIDCTNDIRQLQGGTNVANATYLWQGPNSFTSALANPIVTEPGVYNLSVTGLNGCTGVATTALLDLSNEVMADAFVSDSLDCETTSVLIDGSNSTTGPTITYSWLDVNEIEIGNMMMLSVNAAGNYSLIVNDANTSCFDTIEIEVLGDTIRPLANISTLGAQSITCDDTLVFLSSDGSNPSSNINIEWFFEDNNFSSLSDIEVVNAGEYILEITNLLNNCSDTDTFVVEQNTVLPAIEIMVPDLINCIDSVIELDASSSSAGIDYAYQWSSFNGTGIVNGQTSALPLVDEPGIYTLMIENLLNGCTDSASVIVEADLEYPIAVANVDEILDCFNQSVTLDGTGSSIGNLFEYEWNGGNILSGNQTLNPLVNQTGEYELVVLNTQNGCVSEAVITVEGIDDFITGATIFSTDPTCYEENDGSILIENVTGGTQPYFYIIDGVTTTYNTVENLIAGSYQISVLDSEGCTFDTTILLNQPIQITLDLGGDQDIRLGDSIFLNPQINIPLLQLDTFFWTYEELMPCDTCYTQWVKPFETTPYGLTVVNQNGCMASDDILIRVQKDRLVFIPNIFTPDDDGINDRFMIYGGQDVARINTFRIFDRWGEMLFQRDNFIPNNPIDGWDGTLKGTPMNPAVFVYYAEIEFIDGRVEIYKSDFTLIRN